jgi:hypothetical protein
MLAPHLAKEAPDVVLGRLEHARIVHSLKADNVCGNLTDE